MRIVEAEAIPYWLPFRREYVTARGQLRRREMVLLRLRDDEGHEGWGEAVPLSLRGGSSLPQVAAELVAWAEQAHNLPRATEVGGVSAPARCAILTALADLESRRQNIPLWQFLGAPAANPVPCNATLVSGSPAAVAADAESWAQAGFTTFKLKVGLLADGAEIDADDPDLAQVEAVRAAVGADARLRLDANGSWTLRRAESLLVAAAGFGIELVEQPVAELNEMAELRRRVQARSEGAGNTASPIPIAADESVSSPTEAQKASALGACDLATVKLSKTGQLRPELGGALPFYLSSALDGPVGIAAAAHAFQAMTAAERALPSAAGSSAPLAQGLATQRLFAATIAARECDLVGPLLHLPPGPGLGVEIDAEALAAHRMS